MTPQASTSDWNARRQQGLWLLVCLGLAWLQMSLAGYELGVGNQSIQVPFLLRLSSPTWFSADTMVTTTLAAYPSLFYRALAKLLGFVSVPTLYYVLHFLTAAGVFFTVIELGRAMFKSIWPGVLTCGLLLAGHHQALSEQTLYSTGFTHTWAVFPLTLAALALFYADRPLAAFALTGVSFNIHALEAGQLALILTFWAVWSLRLRQVGWLLAIFVALAAPTIFHMILHREHFDAGWLQLMRIRSANHSFPFTWWRGGQPDVPQFLLILALAGVAMSLVPGPHLRKTLLLTGGVAGLCLIGLLGSEIWPNALVIRAQFFRSSRFLMVIALVYIAAGCVRARGFELLGAGLIVACLAAPPWLHLLPVTVLVATLLALVKRRLLWQQAALAGGALLVTIAAWRTINFVPVAFSWNFHRPELGNDPAWLDAQRWAKTNSPTDAVFLTPAQMSGFRILSQRAIVGEWRDGTQLYFSAAFAQPWWQRMQALQPGMRLTPDGQRLLVQGRSISQLDDAQIIALAGQFHAAYAVLTADKPRKLSAVYRNAKWVIYRPELDREAPVTQPGFFDNVVLPNIEQHRKSNVRLQLLDAAGRPLYDARYRLTETNSAFGFGGLNYRVVTAPAWWSTIEPQEGQQCFADLEQALTPGLTTEFSFLTGFVPAWLRAKPETEQISRLLPHATNVVARFAGRVDYWQVTDQSLFMNQISNLVAALRAQNPGLKLGLSVAPRLDRVDEPRGLDDVQEVKPLDFVAIHGRQPWGVWADPATLYAIFDLFAKEGVRIHITQFAAPAEGWIEGPYRGGQQWTPELQAEYTRQFYTVAFSHPAVDTLNAADPDLVPRDWITRQFWTTTNGTVALDGVVTWRGFHGTYELAVTTASGTTAQISFPVTPGTTNQFRFQLDANGKLERLK